MTADVPAGKTAFNVVFKEKNSDVHARVFNAKSADDAVGDAVGHICEHYGLVTPEGEPDVETFNQQFFLVSARAESTGHNDKVTEAQWNEFKRKWS